MHFIGEHLFPGQLGHFLAVLSLVASGLATICFFKASRSPYLSIESLGWQRLARTAFAVETVAVVGMFFTLYYIISNHLFEYKYAWQHSGLGMQMKYLLSCFWEGQEGSFMLWSFWHCVLGWILIWRSRRWEAPVMSVVSFTQFCLATMLLGIYFFGAKVGSSPFVLLRNEGILDNAPAFQDVANGGIRPDYLSSIKDGQGLNPLLQNYWMVIHPPVLFLGFASTLIPFAFAMASLISRKVRKSESPEELNTTDAEVVGEALPKKERVTGVGLYRKQEEIRYAQEMATAKDKEAIATIDYTSWTKPALPWSLFSAGILGLGIMMGAKWAYESLSFGGYWAWDPVENASLVPWLVMVSGVHTNLIFRHSGYSLRSTYVFYILSFILVLYSTFLTRSGVLGDTSVHAFTDLGMNWQLLLFIIVFLIPAFWLYLTNRRQIPAIRKEEATYSREFWMFIASLIFFLSALVITIKTSLPVYNKVMFDALHIDKLFSGAKKIAPPEDAEFSHNQIQIFVAILIGVLTAVTQYLKYKNTPAKTFFRSLGVPLLITIALGLLITFAGGIEYDKKGPVFKFALYAGVYAALFAIIANASYIWTGIKGRLRLAGASVAHVGFGLVLLGILISASNRKTISNNLTGISPIRAANDPEATKSYENTTLIKGVETDMGSYNVTYTRDSVNPAQGKTFFEIAFKGKTNGQHFKLYPDVIANNKGQEGMSANPDARHYANRDVFAYVTYLGTPEAKAKDTAQYYKKLAAPGDTVFYSNGFWVIDSLQLNPNNDRYHFTANDTAFAADITVTNKSGNRYKARPVFMLHNNQVEQLPDTVMAQSLVFRLNKLTDGQKREVEISVKESDAVMDYITLKVYEFPQINLLWIGVVITVIGFGMSMVQRIKHLTPGPSPRQGV